MGLRLVLRNPIIAKMLGIRQAVECERHFTAVCDAQASIACRHGEIVSSGLRSGIGAEGAKTMTTLYDRIEADFIVVGAGSAGGGAAARGTGGPAARRLLAADPRGGCQPLA